MSSSFRTRAAVANSIRFFYVSSDGPCLCGHRCRHRRKRERERRSVSFPALDPDLSAVALDDLLRDVKAEAEAAIVCRRDLPAAVEALEHLHQLVDRDADAMIGNGGDDLVFLIVHADENLA